MERRRWWGSMVARVLAVLCGLAAVSTPAASANTVLHVDAAKGSDLGGNNCQANPCKTLSYAVTQARAVPDVVTIAVAPGTYTEDLTLGALDSGLMITGAGSGTDPAASTLIDGVSGNPTINTASAGSAASVSLAHLRIVNASTDTSAVISAGATDVALSDVAIDQQGPAAAITAGGDVSIAGGAVTLENASGGTGIQAGGSVSLLATPITSAGTGSAITAGAAVGLAGVNITLSNSANSSAAVTATGRGSSLSHVSISGAWSGSAIQVTGSLVIADSSVSSGTSPGGALVNLTGGGSASGNDALIQRSVLTQHSTTQPLATTINANVTVDSSELLGGGVSVQFQASGGVGRTLTVASSTLDAGTLGIRDASPISSIQAQATDNNPGTAAIVNVAGSILLEPPAATRAGTSSNSVLNCVQSEVPGTTQSATAALGSIACTTGSNGNTFTASVGAIFASPSTGYGLNPSWNGIDSVPESAIAVPPPFADSATDLLGNPRVVNGIGTCQAGVRDKGAIELAGHAGVMPIPTITSPSSIVVGVPATFRGAASNVPASEPVTFSWSSTDGATGTGTRFTHTFKRAARNRVYLTVSGPAACVATTQTLVLSHGLDVITGLKISARTFRAAGSGPSIAPGRGTGTNITYQGTESANTVFTVQLVRIGRFRGKSCRLVPGAHPKGTRCTLYLSVGAFTHSDAAGTVQFHFTGRLLGRKLPPANYRLRAVPTDQVGVGPAAYVSFTIR